MRTPHVCAHRARSLSLALAVTLTLSACGSDDAPAQGAHPADVGADAAGFDAAAALDTRPPDIDAQQPPIDGGGGADALAADGGSTDGARDVDPGLDGAEVADALAADAVVPDGERPPEDGGADAAPDASGPVDPAAVVWFVHISDTHVGEAPEMGRRLTQFLESALPVIEPTATLHTGDLVDLGGEDVQWQEYGEVVHERVPAFPEYLEISGNHDLKQGGTPGYLSTSRSGQAGVGLHGQTFIDTPAGTVRIVRTDTSDTEFNAANVLGFFGEEQADELLALPAPATPPAATFVLGHHPMVGLDRLVLLGSDLRMQRVMQHFEADVYLCGHLHLPYLAWIHETLSVQVGSLTKPVLGSRTFALLALDGGVLSARTVGLDDDIVAQVRWPVVLVTAPINAGLGTSNPLAAPVAPGEPLTVRALVFAPWELESVEAILDFGEPVPLQPLAGAAPLWQVTVPAPEAEGLHGVEVRAAGGGDADSDTLVFRVAR